MYSFLYIYEAQVIKKIHYENFYSTNNASFDTPESILESYENRQKACEICQNQFQVNMFQMSHSDWWGTRKIRANSTKETILILFLK